MAHVERMLSFGLYDVCNAQGALPTQPPDAAEDPTILATHAASEREHRGYDKTDK